MGVMANEGMTVGHACEKEGMCRAPGSIVSLDEASIGLRASACRERCDVSLFFPWPHRSNLMLLRGTSGQMPVSSWVSASKRDPINDMIELVT